MTEDDLPPEIQSPPIAVPETDLLFRLTPRKGEGRYVAIVAAEDEQQARRFAADADPFGADWLNAEMFDCTVSDEPQHHVVGDVVFQSVPKPRFAL